MRIVWTAGALGDLGRLYDFLARSNIHAAARLIETLTSAPDRLVDYPRRGLRVDTMAPDEVRRLMVGPYELRYQVKKDEISILRIFHGKEDRP